MTGWGEVPGVVELPDGRRIRGRGAGSSREGEPRPDFQVVLAGRRPPSRPWPLRWVRWRDFWVPSSTPDAVAVLREAWLRAPNERVEISCRGGGGRTGSALAVLAVLSGVDPEDAVGWIRRHYRTRAVETPWQQTWVRRAGWMVATSE
ncbi:protein-tyrosine phosphatase family protein [Arachnia propionica]|uniref:Protein phosphatase n=1 Tax=Arachnia propionica TaxID=1750 RepID=A0A3P1WNC4_9ACTN|nr:protein-tyrosine phosphatase family protein [Arachnia propionica]RRD48129.1 protein phosphatase [Arachnia propionica]